MADKFNVLIEDYKITKESKDGVKVSGLALPFDKKSRNGFTYITESIKAAHQSLEGAPVLFNHDSDKVIGHVKTVSVGESGMNYEMDLDPEERIVNKLKRGDIKKVSIQCMYDEDKSYIDEEGTTHAYISEFLELSVVTIPGFADTSAQVVEKLQEKKEEKPASEPGDVDKADWEKAKKAFQDSYEREPSSNSDWAIVMSIYKKIRGEEQMDDKKQEQEEHPLDKIMKKIQSGEELSEEEQKMLAAAIDAAKNGEEGEKDQEEPEEEEEEKKEEKDEEPDKMDKMYSMLEEIKNMLTPKEESKENKEEEEKEEETKQESKESKKEDSKEQTDPEEEEKKKEEALENNKMTSSEGYIQKKEKQLTKADIKNAFMNL